MFSSIRTTMARLLGWMALAGCAVGLGTTNPTLSVRGLAFDSTLGFPGEGPPRASREGPPALSLDEWGRRLALFEPARPFDARTSSGRQLLDALSGGRAPAYPHNDEWHLLSHDERLICHRWIRVVLGQPDAQLNERNHYTACRRCEYRRANQCRPPSSSLQPPASQAPASQLPSSQPPTSQPRPPPAQPPSQTSQPTSSQPLSAQPPSSQPPALQPPSSRPSLQSLHPSSQRSTLDTPASRAPARQAPTRELGPPRPTQPPAPVADSPSHGLAVPFTVSRVRRAGEWARYSGTSFVPIGQDPRATASWFLCPLIADAGGLSELYPLSVVPRPDLPAAWATLPNWSGTAVRNLTWPQLVGFAASALEQWHVSMGGGASQAAIRQSLLGRMDMRNHWRAEFQDELVALMVGLPGLPTDGHLLGLDISDAISEVSQVLAMGALQLPQDPRPQPRGRPLDLEAGRASRDEAEDSDSDDGDDTPALRDPADADSDDETPTLSALRSGALRLAAGASPRSPQERGHVQHDAQMQSVFDIYDADGGDPGRADTGVADEYDVENANAGILASRYDRELDALAAEVDLGDEDASPYFVSLRTVAACPAPGCSAGERRAQLAVTCVTCGTAVHWRCTGLAWLPTEPWICRNCPGGAPYEQYPELDTVSTVGDEAERVREAAELHRRRAAHMQGPTSSEPLPMAREDDSRPSPSPSDDLPGFECYMCNVRRPDECQAEYLPCRHAASESRLCVPCAMRALAFSSLTDAGEPHCPMCRGAVSSVGRTAFPHEPRFVWPTVDVVAGRQARRPRGAFGARRSDDVDAGDPADAHVHFAGTRRPARRRRGGDDPDGSEDNPSPAVPPVPLTDDQVWDAARLAGSGTRAARDLLLRLSDAACDQVGYSRTRGRRTGNVRDERRRRLFYELWTGTPPPDELTSAAMRSVLNEFGRARRALESGATQSRIARDPEARRNIARSNGAFFGDPLPRPSHYVDHGRMATCPDVDRLHSFPECSVDSVQWTRVGQACMCCEAALFPPEECEVPRRRGRVHGRSCCAQGQVCIRPVLHPPEAGGGGGGPPDGAEAATSGDAVARDARALFHDAFLSSPVSMSYGMMFRRWGRLLNSMFAMVCQTVLRREMPARGMPAYVVNCRLTHRVGALLPDAGGTPRFAQMYVHDEQTNPDVADVERSVAPRRVSSNVTALRNYFARQGSAAPGRPTRELLEDMVQRILAVLRRCNPYVAAFVTAGQRMAELSPDEQMHVRLEIDSGRASDRAAHVPDGSNGRRGLYSEVAILTNEEGITGEHFAALGRGGNMQRMRMDHPAFDPMYFVLLFPYGDDGWRAGMTLIPKWSVAPTTLADPRWPSLHGAPHDVRRSVVHSGRTRITPMQYYAHRLHWRNGDLHAGGRRVLMSGRLFQEYVCTAWARTESERLMYHVNNQATIRVDTYSSLRAAYDNAQAEGAPMPACGRTVVLSRSFIGGPRDIANRYHDAMAVIRATRKPSLFITMTCNPRWREIQQCLPYNSKPEDHPELLARVFKMKLDELLRDIKDRHVLGRAEAIMSVVEFQYRGLPHAHILVVLCQADASLTTDRIDDIVSTELPPETQPRLRNLVLEHMVHNDCEADHGCMCRRRSDGRECRWKFPREYCDVTSWSESVLFPRTRRRRGDSAMWNGRVVTNQWVAGYNAYLLDRYECHFNIEVVASLDSVKYLCTPLSIVPPLRLLASPLCA